jgi:hypothetical protein
VRPIGIPPKLAAVGFFSPVYDGAIDFEAIPDDFAERIARRVRTGLLVPGRRGRANYVVQKQAPDAISFAAKGFWTAYNVGLNNVELQLEGKRILYHGSFRRWTLYAVIHGFVIALVILIGILVLPESRNEISRTPGGWPFVGALLVFFGLAWPWLLVALQRRFVPRALERIVRESLAA